jgi:flavin reductase (DIM6/NTAB) family NADH-FMN oxidoreductase RutF
MLNPLPAVMVSCKGLDNKNNIVTVAWCGNACTNPPILYISLRPERYSYNIIKETNEFVVNLVNEELTYACDYCGVKSGRDVDKFKDTKLTKLESRFVKAPSILESPVSIECRVNKIIDFSDSNVKHSHHMILADILGVTVDKELLDEKGRFNLDKAGLISYSHGEYYALGEYLGKFGYSIAKKNKKK